MITRVQWFPTIAQVRQAMLDLLTSGVPRDDISVLFSHAQGRLSEEGSEEQVAAEALGTLDNTQTRPLPEGGEVTIVGTLTRASEGVGGDNNQAFYRTILNLFGIGMNDAEARAEQLRSGGALIVVQTDAAWDTIISGVFRHGLNPDLNGPPVEPVDLREADPARAEPPGAAVGGLTGGAVPGGWGSAGQELEWLGDEEPQSGQ
jgi:hypothetical protein